MKMTKYFELNEDDISKSEIQRKPFLLSNLNLEAIR